MDSYIVCLLTTILAIYSPTVFAGPIVGERFLPNHQEITNQIDSATKTVSVVGSGIFNLVGITKQKFKTASDAVAKPIIDLTDEVSQDVKYIINRTNEEMMIRLGDDPTIDPIQTTTGLTIEADDGTRKPLALVDPLESEATEVKPKMSPTRRLRELDTVVYEIPVEDESSLYDRDRLGGLRIWKVRDALAESDKDDSAANSTELIGEMVSTSDGNEATTTVGRPEVIGDFSGPMVVFDTRSQSGEEPGSSSGSVEFGNVDAMIGGLNVTSSDNLVSDNMVTTVAAEQSDNIPTTDSGANLVTDSQSAAGKFGGFPMNIIEEFLPEDFKLVSVSPPKEGEHPKELPIISEIVHRFQ